VSPLGNPFATRFTQPAAGEYLFPGDVDAEALVARLRGSGWWGQITGPHGSGKSTLVQTLLPRIEATGRVIVFHTVSPFLPRSASFALPFGSRPAGVVEWGSATQIVLDGFEQLGWLQRTWWKWQCRRHGAGLLVIGHDDLGLPPLWQTETSAELTRLVVYRLLGESKPAWLPAEQLDEFFAAHQGNVREVLFALYDLYEQQSRCISSKKEPRTGREEESEGGGAP
jgi:hypothetical protein